MQRLGSPTSTDGLGLSQRDRVYVYLLERIQNGSFTVGTDLPSTRELAAQFGHSITPVNQALALLHRDGLVKRIHGSGVRVIARSLQQGRVLAKPTIDLITTLESQPGLQPDQSHAHTLPAIDEWLVHQLSIRRDMRLTVSSMHGDIDRELVAHLREASIHRPRILVLSSPQDFPAEAERELVRLRESGITVIYLAARRHIPQLDRVVMDFEAGQYALARHLLEKGHRRIIRLRTSSAYYFEDLKQQGFRKALADYGFEPEWAEKCTLDTPALDESRPQSLLHWLSRHLISAIRTHSATAVMAYDDPCVAAVQIALKQASIPGIAVTGYDNNWHDLQEIIETRFGSEAIDLPPLASIDTHLPEVGQVMAGLIVERIQGTLPDQPQRRMVRQTLSVPA